MYHPIRNYFKLENEFKSVSKHSDCGPDIYLPLFLNMIRHPRAIHLLFELRAPSSSKNIPRQKHICRVIMFALSIYYPHIYKIILCDFIDNGCWVDVLYISKWTIDYGGDWKVGLEQMASSIYIDPLCSKWVPNEKSKWNRAPYYLADRLMAILKMSPKEYRHTIVELRRGLNLVEVNMSAQEFDKIDFEKLPSTVRKNYENAFQRKHNSLEIVSQERTELSTRYNKFLKSKAVPKPNCKETNTPINRPTMSIGYIECFSAAFANINKLPYIDYELISQITKS